MNDDRNDDDRSDDRIVYEIRFGGRVEMYEI